jgi:flagellin
MSLVLDTNIASLNAQNNLTGSQALLNQSLERLSSGLRINSAADDAAGLAISQQFTTQINGTNQAVSNANDAVSEAQTTAGALNTIVNNLQSIRTLAVEAANGSNSSSDRTALNNQVQQQIAEISQIAQQTTFNGLNVLNGTSGTTVYQVGANVGDTIAVSLGQGVAANQIGQYSTLTGGDVTATQLTSTASVTLSNSTGTVTVGPSANYVGANLPYQGASSAYAKAAAINAAGLQGLTATAATSVTDSAAFTPIVGATTGTDTNNVYVATTYGLTINGTVIYGANNAVASGDTLTGQDVVDQINEFTGTTGVTASLTTTGTTGELVLSNTDGSTINAVQTISLGTAGTGGATAGVAGSGTGATATVATTGAGTTSYGQVTLTDANPVTITDNGTGGGSAALGFTSGNATTLGTASLANQTVLTVAAANSTITSVDSALATVSAFQSQLGAIQNRFTSAVSNLTSTAQNLTQSRSTIQDADFAAETANLTQAQVLEQAGISVLAQANQQPQLILKLLQ